VAADYLQSLFSLEGQVAVVTGGTGALGSAMARALGRAGARLGILGRSRDRAEALAAELRAEGALALPLTADVLERSTMEAARDALQERWGRIDILVNAAGGNLPKATVSDRQPFFTLERASLETVVDLNLLGTLLPCQVFGAVMAEVGHGCIVNVSSMAAGRALTRVVGYGAAKAAVEQLTRWLAVELAQRYGGDVRVNAIAPGFFVGEQNRGLLLNDDGSLTERGRTIIEHTPAGRFGEPGELAATLLWLCSPGAAFVNGVVVPVDGGFSAFSGV